jgi:hypothetical protein
MDELWQRYRAFWTPVLWGVGVFLAGLIVVFVMTDDPEAGQKANQNMVSSIKRKTAPTPTQISTTRANAEIYEGRVKQWAPLLDQRAGEADPLNAGVRQALVAAFLRGTVPADPARFDGDTAAVAEANAKFAELEPQILDSLRQQDPNVSFSRFKAYVVQQLAQRANRADVDVGPGADEFGLAAIASVNRAELPWRVMNLALATLSDVAIREGTRSIDQIVIQPQEVRGSSTGPEPYVSEWPVSFGLTATPDCIAALLDVVTDPKHPTALGRSTVERTPQKSDGYVRGDLKVYSLLVRPEVSLGLESEAGGN